MLEEINVRGRSLSIASISVTIVWSSGRRMFALPKTFHRATLKYNEKNNETFPEATYQGARFEMNFHCTVRLLRCVYRNSDFRSFSSSSAADWYVEALSEIIILW